MNSRRFLIFLLWGAALSAGPKVAPDLNRHHPDDIDVIVQYKKHPTTAHIEKVKGKGGRHHATFHHARSAAFRVSPAAAAELAEDEEVLYVSPDRPLRGALDVSRSAIGAVTAQSYGWTGTGIGVAIIDSGSQDHPDIKANIVYRESFVPTVAIGEVYGHGLHVAGIVAGTGGKSTGTYKGIAPAAKLIMLKALDDKGAGQDSWVIAAINRAIALKSTYNIRVMNLSLGRQVRESFKTDPLCQAVEAAWKAGIVVVVSAGNAGRNNTAGNLGYGTITSPGNDPYVITVGAVNTRATAAATDDNVPSYSSKGPTMIDHLVKPDLVAPGNRVVSLDLDGPKKSSLVSQYAALKVNDAYMRLSGTSMAAPMVSGAAALLLQKNPAYTPDQVKAVLMRTAAKSFAPSVVVTDPGTNRTFNIVHDLFTIGAGSLNIWAALNDTSAPAANLSALSPGATRNASTGAVSLVFGPNVVWGSSIVWGNNVVWGSTIIWGTSVVWGSSIIWGEGGAAGASIIWSDSSPWVADVPSTEATAITVTGEN